MVFQELMKKGIDNLIAFFLIVLFFSYVIIGSIIDYRTKKEIINKGRFSVGIIYKEFIGARVSNTFTYKFIYKKNEFLSKKGVNDDFFNSHQIGDTIIIKFLPEDPTKSIIIEEVEYKSCMGLPPKEGWKELPRCESLPLR